MDRRRDDPRGETLRGGAAGLSSAPKVTRTGWGIVVLSCHGRGGELAQRGVAPYATPPRDGRANRPSRAPS